MPQTHAPQTCEPPRPSWPSHRPCLECLRELRAQVGAVKALADRLEAEPKRLGGGPGEEIQLGRWQVLDELRRILGP